MALSRTSQYSTQIRFQKVSITPNQELDEKIRMARDVFKGLLENNEKLKAFDALITITNKDEENLTKFILKEVDPETKYNEVRIFLNTYFSEYMGG